MEVVGDGNLGFLGGIVAEEKGKVLDRIHLADHLEADGGGEFSLGAGVGLHEGGVFVDFADGGADDVGQVGDEFLSLHGRGLAGFLPLALDYVLNVWLGKEAGGAGFGGAGGGCLEAGSEVGGASLLTAEDALDEVPLADGKAVWIGVGNGCFFGGGHGYLRRRRRAVRP